MAALAVAGARPESSPEVSLVFARMLPTIQKVAAYGLRHTRPAQRQEFTRDVIARAYVAFIALAARGKMSLAYPTVLARYAIRQIHDGRELACPQNSNDVLSPLAQRRRMFQVQHQSAHDQWEDLVADRRATPAEIVACRIDFRSWLAQLGEFQRQLALRLAAGDTAQDAAQHFRLSQGRISQLRKALRANWQEFQGVPLAA